jgi:hypothetical protein
MIATILLVLAFACFVIAAANFLVPRINLVALGLALWVAVLFVGKSMP